MSGDPYFLHRYRRAEGSGPWLHPPRPARPGRRHRSIGLRYILLAALALSACSTTSDGVKRVYGDPGGNISLRANEIRRLDNEGIRVEIRGDVVSSGAMYLGAQEVCIEHGVGVTFHAPHRQGLPVSEADFKMGVWEMAAYLPGEMAARLHDDWSNQSFLAGERLTAAEVVEMSNGHVPFCGPARLK